MTTTGVSKRLLSSEEAALYLGIAGKPDGGRRILKELRDRRAIPFHRLGRRTVVYPQDGLDRLLATTRINAVGEEWHRDKK